MRQYISIENLGFVLQMVLEGLVNEYNNKTGKTLAIVATGTGGMWGSLINVPGASKVVQEVYIPYSPTAFSSMLAKPVADGNLPFQSVSVEALKTMQNHLKNRWKSDDVTKVAITGALTTNRYRKGEDQAYIAIDDNVYNVKFEKVSKAEYDQMTPRDISAYRMNQDVFLMLFVYNKLMGIENDFSDVEGVTIASV